MRAFNLTLARVEEVLPRRRKASRSCVSAEEVEDVDVGEPSSASTERVGDARPRTEAHFWANSLEAEEVDRVFSEVLAPLPVQPCATPEGRRSSSLREMSLRLRQDSAKCETKDRRPIFCFNVKSIIHVWHF